jgi:hypothetical protein
MGLYPNHFGTTGTSHSSTAITYQLHPLGPSVLAGSLVYEWKRVREALRLYAEFSARAPDTLNTDAALITMPDGNHGFAISALAE